jgi:hypothetical protein
MRDEEIAPQNARDMEHGIMEDASSLMCAATTALAHPACQAAVREL